MRRSEQRNLPYVKIFEGKERYYLKKRFYLHSIASVLRWGTKINVEYCALCQKR